MKVKLHVNVFLQSDVISVFALYFIRGIKQKHIDSYLCQNCKCLFQRTFIHTQ